MNKQLNESSGKICLEIIYEGQHEIPNVEVSASTIVLGGKISRIDWEGSVFSDCDWFMNLFDGEQMSFICNRPEYEQKVREVIYKALDKLIEEIEWKDEFAEE